MAGKEGIETPDLYNFVFETMLVTVYGLGMTGAGWYTHVVWADNVWLYVRTRHILHRMAQAATKALAGAGLSRKLSPLEVLTGMVSTPLRVKTHGPAFLPVSYTHLTLPTTPYV